MTLIVREMRGTDLISVREIISGINGRRAAEEFSLEPSATMLVADHSGMVVGCAGYVADWSLWGAYTISWVRVAKQRQRSGIGRTLVAACLRQISAVGCLAFLGTTIPEYYEQHWGFTTLLRVKSPEYDDLEHHLMYVRLP